MAEWVRELEFPRLNIPITIDAIYPVTPAGPFPAAHGDSLYLSNLDDMVGSRVFTPTVYFYPPDDRRRGRIGEVFRRALADVLVPYYPLSGRLRATVEGKLEVFFGPEQGALMVEARSALRLADLGDLRVPNPGWAPLIYRFPEEGPYQVVDMPLVIAQLTTFGCGGFCLGLRVCHCICDGLGAMQFLDAWATSARLGPTVSPPQPCWDREFFRPRVPPRVEFPHYEFASIEEGSSLGFVLSEAKLVQKCYSVGEEFRARLKRLAQSDGESPRTGFDALAAHVWRSWVKAIEIRPLDYELRLTFSVNVRPKLRAPPLREGFYGNALCVACATSTAARLAEGTLSAAAGRVREARMAVSEDHVRSTVDYIEAYRPTRLEFAGKLSITQWTRFSMYESSDFGWGRPLYAGPIDLMPTPQMCVFLPDGDAAGDGTSLVVWICLPEYAAGKFGECLSQLD